MNHKLPILTGIYKVTSPSGGVYIGQSWDIYARWRGHSTYGKNYINNSLKKYGKRSHRFEIIHELPSDVDQSIMDVYEILYIEMYKISGHRCLNIRGGGSNGKMSEQTKEKIRSYVRTPETLKKMSESHVGLKQSEDQKNKVRIRMLSYKHTEETKRKIGEKSKLRCGEKHPNFGKKRSIEVRNKMSIALKGKYSGEKASFFAKKHSKETIDKMKASALARWAKKSI